LKFARPEFLLFFSILAGCDPQANHPVLGTVFQVQGTATITDNAQGSKPRPLSAGLEFSNRSDIHLERESEAVFSLTPGIYLRCFGESNLRVEKLTISKDGDETGNAMHTRDAVFHFDKGRVHVFLPISGKSQAKLKIQSLLGTVAAKAGSLFSVSQTGASIRVLCADGELNWSEQPSFSATIRSGYFLDRGRGAAAESKPASEDPSAQEEIMALLESSRTILDLEQKTRNAPAPWRH
jgi:hypothetical protein